MRALKGSFIYLIFAVSLIVLIASFNLISSFQSRAMIELERFSAHKGLPSIVYDVKNRVIGQFGHRRQIEVTVSKLPESVIQPFISAEDQDFYNHSGISLKGLFRALIANIKQGYWVQGASTITQQLVRNTMLSRDKTIIRKLKEIILSLALERQLTKQQILERYLNILFFGRANYGIEAAAKSYFGKPAALLSWGEASLLAAVIKAPSKYDLRSKLGLQKAIQRRKYVLKRLVDDGHITQTQMVSIENKKLKILKSKDAIGPYPYAMFAIKRELKQRYSDLNLSSGGYKIFTSLNLDLLRASKKVVNRLAKIQWLKTKSEQAIGFVLIDPKTGGISAIWGGEAFKKSQFNTALQAKRPMGVMILPHLISRLLAYGYNLQSGFDRLTSKNQMIGTAPPEATSLSVFDILSQQLLYESTPLAVEMGLGSLRGFLDEINLSTNRNDYDLVWGMSEHSLVNLSSSYSIYANAGRYSGAYLIEKILDSSSNLLLSGPKKLKGRQVLSESLSYLTNEAMFMALPEDLKRSKFSSNSYGGIDLTKQNAWQVIWSDKLIAGVWWGAKTGKQTISISQRQRARRFNAVHRYVKTHIPGLMHFSLKQPAGVIYRPYQLKAATARKRQVFLPEVITSRAKVDSVKM